MKLLKKWGALIVAIVAIIAIAITIILGQKSIKKLKAAVSDRDTQISTLETSLEDIGPTHTGYVLNTDVRAGEKIKPEYFTEVSVPDKLGLGAINADEQSAEDLKDWYFRMSLKEGTVLTADAISETEIVDSQRYVDVILDQNPIGIKEGDYIDVRITFTYGQDFVVLANKKVEEYNDGILKLVLNEYEIEAYNSAIVDTIAFEGTKLWATVYVDAGSQDGAEAFYPVNSEIDKILMENPNSLELASEKKQLERQAMLEKMNSGEVSEQTEDALEQLLDQIESARERMSDNISNINERVQEKMEAEREAAEAAENGEEAEESQGIEF